MPARRRSAAPRSAAAPLPYEVQRRRRKTIGLSVSREGVVQVSAPRWVTRRDVEEAIDRHRDWLDRQRREALERLARRPPLKYVTGEQIRYLGRPLELRIREVSGATTSAGRHGAELHVRVPRGLSADDRRQQVRGAVVRWLLGRATKVFDESHRRVAELVGRSAVRIVVKDMKTQWGSCGPSRRMSLHWRLVLAPRAVIDYVIVHELCHISIPDHSRRFWRKVETACPDWREHRHWLRDRGDELEI